MTEMSGGQILVRLLVAAGIRTVYGVAGGALTPLFAALADTPEIDYLGVRHEAAGALMATATFQADSQLAVCLAEQGPGTHNLVAGLGPARTNGLALLAITVSGHAFDAQPSRGALMDLDAVATLGTVTKSSARVGHPTRLPEVVRRAVRAALSGRPGPVHIDIPRDVLASSIEVADPAQLDVDREHWAAAARPLADPAAVARAAEVARHARRPLVIAGGGAARAGGAAVVRELVGRLGAAAITTQSGIGVIASDGPGFVGQGGVLGGPAVTRAMAEADVVIAIGCRFSSWLWRHGQPVVAGWPDQDLVQIDIDPEAIGHLRPVTVGLAGDARLVTGQLVAALAPTDGIDRAWVAGLEADLAGHRDELAKLATDTATPMHPAALAAALAGLLPADALVALDGGHVSFWGNSFLPATAPGQLLHDPGMGQLGSGLPTANALAARHPGRTVVNITGDGSFGFTIAELDTARRYNLRAVHVIHDNASWGVVSVAQQRAGFAFGTDLAGTDYAAIARGFGCHGERVDHWDELVPALRRALDHDGPAVVDVRVRFAAHPMFGAFGAMMARPTT